MKAQPFWSEKRFQGLVLAGVAASLWAVLAIALKVASKEVSSESIVGFRFLVASLVQIVMLSFWRPQAFHILRKPPPMVLIAGLCLAANYFGFMKGIELTSPSNAQILIQMGPLMLVVLGILLFKEIPRWSQAVGMLVALLGFVFFFREQLSLAGPQKDNHISGDLWVLFAAITWAAYAALQKRLSKSWSSYEVNLLIFLLSFLIFAPFIDWQELPGWSLGTWALMVFLGVNTFIAYGAIALALKYSPASQVSLIIAVNPLGTLLLMQLLDYWQVDWISPDPIQFWGYLGATLVILGVTMTVYQPARSSRL